MIDGHKGVLAALNLGFGGSYNIFCARHMFANLNT